MSELIVVGGGIAGLSAAIHARLAGWEVLLLERSAVLGGKAAGVRLGAYALDPGPSIVILPHLYEAVFATAGRRMEEYLQFRPLPRAVRAWFEGLSEPLDFPTDLDGAVLALRDIAPGDASALRDLVERLDRAVSRLDRTVFARPFARLTDLMCPDLLALGRAFPAFAPYRSLVDARFRHPLVRAFFYGFPSYSGQTWRARGPGPFWIPYFMLRGGVYAVEGGVRAIPLALERLATELGVVIRRGASVARLDLTADERHAAGVTLTDGEKLLAAAVILAVDPYAFLPDWRARALPPSLSYFTVTWGVRRELSELDHHTLFVPRDFESHFRAVYDAARPPERPIVYVNAPRARDPDAAPPGAENVFAVVTVPAMADGLDWEAATPLLVSAIRRQLAAFGVAWSDAEIDFERVQSPVTFAERDGNYRGSLYGPAETHRRWGLFPAPNAHPRWPNVAFAGGAVQPGAGLPMALLSGRFAVQAVGARR